MVWAWLADLLTFSRLGVAVWLIWLGAAQGRAALPSAVIVTLAAWLGDSLDGWFARRADRPTRLGAYDFVFDVILTWSALIYITLSGFLPVWLTALYTLLAGVVVAAFQRKTVMVLFMRPVDVTCGMVVLTQAPREGWLLAVTLAGLAVAHRRDLRARFTRWLRELAETWRSSWRGRG